MRECAGGGEPEPDLDALVGELLEHVRNVNRLAVIFCREALPTTGRHDCKKNGDVSLGARGLSSGTVNSARETLLDLLAGWNTPPDATMSSMRQRSCSPTNATPLRACAYHPCAAPCTPMAELISACVVEVPPPLPAFPIRPFSMQSLKPLCPITLVRNAKYEQSASSRDEALHGEARKKNDSPSSGSHPM